MSQALVTLRREDPSYPPRLRRLRSPPRVVSFEGEIESGAGSGFGARTVAMVGTRTPTPEAEQFAFDVAGALARNGVTVISGGALGIDAAAHRGALASGGRTVAVAASGANHCFPKEHAALFREIARGPGAVVWPFEPDVPAIPGNFLRRNGVLVALSDAVLIVQAGAPSGTLNAASWATKLACPVWAVPGPPWDPKFTGCRAAIDAGARVLTSLDGFLRALGVADAQLALPIVSPARARPATSKGDPKPPLAPPIEDAVGAALFSACTAQPQHTDKIAEKAGICAKAALTRLLTLALENVLVEGPEGFYRRAD